MHLTSNPAALPGNCFVCRGVRELYVDTEIQMDWYGAVYVCDECIMHLGRMIGMISKAQVDVLVGENTALSDRNFELTTRLAALSKMEETLNALVDARSVGVDDSILGGRSISPIPSYDEVADGADRSDDDGAPGAEALVGSGAGATPEPLHDEGVGVVRTDGGSHAGEFVIG